MITSSQRKISFLFGGLVIPLAPNGAWKEVQFNGLKPNQVQFQKDQIKIDVDKSASPLIYRLDKVYRVTGFDLLVRVELDEKEGKLPQSPDSQFEEDSLLRLGLVATGEQRLTGIKKMLAAGWVKELFKLVPEKMGLDKIIFYNLSTSDSQVGKSRTHPKSQLMQENVLEKFKKPSTDFRFSKRLDSPISTAALWLSIDGDDTGAKFSTTIKEINLQFAD